MNDLILFYDTETTGLPDWHEPSDAPQQPHIVQLAAALVDAESRRIIQSLDLIVAPEDWAIPDEAAAIHGIHTQMAKRLGSGEAKVLELFLSLWASADRRVGHSESFDARIVRIAAKRYIDDEFADHWKAGEAECTGRLAKQPMGITGRRIPKLTDACEHFLVAFDHNVAHNAWADMHACMDLYFALFDQEPAEATA